MLNEADQIVEMENREGEAEREFNEWANSLNRFHVDVDDKQCFNWNPLHVAAFTGETESLKNLLERRPLLAETVDSHQRSPLHLASANGHVEIVKILAAVSPKMCLACDRDGLNPVHAAAISGKVEVFDVLFKANPHAVRARVGRAQYTILHLCVNYDQRAFLDMLLIDYFKGKDLVNAKDNDGNNILHLAVADKRLEIIIFLLKHTLIDVRATNARNRTALNILLRGQRKGAEPAEDDILIEDILRHYNCPIYLYNAEHTRTIMIVATLMVTIAFQAGVNPPGGFWQDNSDGHIAGEAVMAYNHPNLYGSFIASNVVVVIFSLTTIMVSGYQLLEQSELLTLMMWMSIWSIFITVAFGCAIVAFTPSPTSKSSISPDSTASVATGRMLLSLLVLLVGSQSIGLLIRRTLNKRRTWYKTRNYQRAVNSRLR